MLVTNVSLRPPRAGIAASIAEVTAATDATTTSFVVATLVDEPASSVGDFIDAYLGEIMLEAASAAAVIDAGLAYAAAIVETISAIDTQDAVGGVIPLSIGGTPITLGSEYEHGVGSSYAGFTVTASGGAIPYTYSVASGTLPSGITLNSSTGAVSGTPAFQSAGIYSGIVIRVTDNVGATANLASFTLTIAFKDPYYSNVGLLLDYDEADANAVFTDQKSGVTMATAGNAQHDTGVTPLYGTSSFLFDGTGDAIRFGDSPLWNLASANFTIDFTARPTSVTGTRFWIGQWSSTPTLGWVLNQNGSQVALNVSTTGSDNFVDLTSAAGALVINTWARWRVDFDGAKYRLYKNGTMVASSTTLRTINNSTEQLAIGSNSVVSTFYFIGNCRGIRLTLGTARTASDSGYTISNRAFPTS